jgi:8-oxo-dGTP pyrophosphatase MutT (NUDIX family)/DNA repair photolyase
MSKIQQRDKDKPFYLENRRAMISLGPLNKNAHCAFRCAYCYVQDEFISYASLNDNEIITFLRDNRQAYNIIYVSGDTDSFASPRTDRALRLLYKIVMEINCDLLFTTRATFSDSNYEIIKQIIEQQKKLNKMLYACVSITRFSEDYAYLEPTPIPLPGERIIVLKKLKELGAVTVLATRPFLPTVNVDDYIRIIDKSKEFVDIVLGECFYFIRGGKVEKRVFPNGISPEIERNITHNQRMPFDNNKALWDIWNSDEYEQTVAARCKELGIVFSMHSDNAITEYLKNENKIELWDLFNESREKTGETLERGKALPQGRYHLVAGAWIKNSQGQFLISQRHPNKNYPNYWECTGGSVRTDENSLEGAVREVFEELGIVLNPDNSLLFHQTRRDGMQDFYDAWLFHADIPVISLKLQPTEVTKAKWVSKDTLYEMYLNKEIHPLIDYIEKLLKQE